MTQHSKWQIAIACSALVSLSAVAVSMIKPSWTDSATTKIATMAPGVTTLSKFLMDEVPKIAEKSSRR